MEKRVERLADQCEYWYTKMSDFVFKHTTFQLIIAGWLASSKSSIAGLDTNIKLMLSGLLIIYSFFCAGIYSELKSKSIYVFDRLKQLDKIILEDNIRYKITNKYFIGVSAAHLLISVISIVLIFNT